MPDCRVPPGRKIHVRVFPLYTVHLCLWTEVQSLTTRSFTLIGRSMCRFDNSIFIVLCSAHTPFIQMHVVRCIIILHMPARIVGVNSQCSSSTRALPLRAEKPPQRMYLRQEPESRSSESSNALVILTFVAAFFILSPYLSPNT